MLVGSNVTLMLLDHQLLRNTERMQNRVAMGRIIWQCKLLKDIRFGLAACPPKNIVLQQIKIVIRRLVLRRIGYGYYLVLVVTHLLKTYYSRLYFFLGALCHLQYNTKKMS